MHLYYCHPHTLISYLEGCGGVWCGRGGGGVGGWGWLSCTQPYTDRNRNENWKHNVACSININVYHNVMPHLLIIIIISIIMWLTGHRLFYFLQGCQSHQLVVVAVAELVVLRWGKAELWCQAEPAGQLYHRPPAGRWAGPQGLWYPFQDQWVGRCHPTLLGEGAWSPIHRMEGRGPHRG